MKTKRSSLRNSVVENNNEKTAVYSQNSSITDIMATNDGKFQYSTDGGQSFEEVSTQVDATLSTTSENPVQNKVITENINNIVNNVTKLRNPSTLGFSAGLASLSTSGGAIGYQAKSTAGGAIGYNAKTEAGGAVGTGTLSGDGFAGGTGAKCAQSGNDIYDNIQLGTGTNSTKKTLQIYNDNIYNANTHTLTVENAQIDGNITDGTNSITVAELTQTKPKLIGTYSPNPDTSEDDTTSKYPKLGSNSTTLNFDTEIPFVDGKFYVVVMKSTGFGTSRPAQWNGMYFNIGMLDNSVSPIFNGVIGGAFNNTATVTPSYLYIANKQQFVVTTNYSQFLEPHFSFSSLQFDVYEM